MGFCVPLKGMEMFNSANAQFRRDFHVHDRPTPWVAAFYRGRFEVGIHLLSCEGSHNRARMEA